MKATESTDIMTIILPEIPAGTAHICRHTENSPIQTVELPEAAETILAAIVQGHRVEKMADTPSGVTIKITRQTPRIPNRFGVNR